ncbi:aminotransferase class I/II-fold pyridoxal phosphate-dependent enzyme [Chloroflexi bacterium TSY]|nr:aminotransferase class I/II-fold pyridoxal phosphate-dependent enzyme [Chloroflexi bacterium TSY]
MNSVLNLLSNENVLGPSPKATAAIQKALGEIHLYSNDVEHVFLDALIHKHGHGFTAANFVSGNGSSDVLRMVAQSLLQPGQTAVIAAPTFGIYAGFTNLYGGSSISVPLRNYTADLPALLSAVDERTRLVFLCNPNNPTGTFVSHSAIEEFLQQLPPHVTLVLDEAYREFGDHPDLPQAEEWVTAGHNIIVTRTLSKLYGLAGLRAGYGLACADLIERVRQYRGRHHCGRPTWFGGSAALADSTFIEQTLSMVRTSRSFYYAELPKLKIGYVPTQANYILLKDLPLTASQLVQQAEAQGLLLNHTAWAGLPENVRITFARPHENERVIKTLAGIIGDGVDGG